MFKTEAGIGINCKERGRTQKNIQVIMHRLQTLDGKISELICQCEELRKTAVENKDKEQLCSQSEELRKTAVENKDKEQLCSQCGNEIEAGQEAIIRDLVGTEIGRCHRACLQELLQWKES
jgi:uncharacterized protein with PIN domain